jgi:hypothetical protein
MSQVSEGTGLLDHPDGDTPGREPVVHPVTDRERWPCPECEGDVKGCASCDWTGVCAACREVYWPG